MEEIWKDIPSYEGYYQVSDMGNVRSLLFNKVIVKKPQISNYGYRVVGIHRSKSKILFKVSRLVLWAFVGESELYVDHINGIRHDDRLINLRYCTPRENTTFQKLKTNLFTGASKSSRGPSWESRIHFKRKKFFLGTFDEPEPASIAYFMALDNIENSGHPIKRPILTTKINFMITREQLEESFGDDRKAFVTKDVDHDVKVITLLRERIPYDVCKSIIGGAEHDVLYLCDIDELLPYLNDEDVSILADCNVWIDDDCDCLALFV